MLSGLILAVVVQLGLLSSILLKCAKGREAHPMANRVEPTTLPATQKDEVATVQVDDELPKQESSKSRQSGEVEDSSPIIELPDNGQLGTRRVKYQSLLTKEKKSSTKRDEDSQRVTFNLQVSPPTRTSSTGPVLPRKSLRDSDTKLIRN